MGFYSRLIREKKKTNFELNMNREINTFKQKFVLARNTDHTHTHW